MEHRTGLARYEGTNEGHTVTPDIFPLVSVVIPAYNAEGFIRDALESVSNQTFVDYEIVVVNDGSEDGTVRELDHD